MTRDEARELAIALMHYADGGEVEIRSRPGDPWVPFSFDVVFSAPTEFRKKPEKENSCDTRRS